MICKHCNEEIDEEVEGIVRTMVDGKKTIMCRECYEDYWYKKDKK